MADGFMLYTSYYGILDFNFQNFESVCDDVRMLNPFPSLQFPGKTSLYFASSCQSCSGEDAGPKN